MEAAKFDSVSTSVALVLRKESAKHSRNKKELCDEIKTKVNTH
jgi:hypothetical protein